MSGLWAWFNDADAVLHYKVAALLLLICAWLCFAKLTRNRPGLVYTWIVSLSMAALFIFYVSILTELSNDHQRVVSLITLSLALLTGAIRRRKSKHVNERGNYRRSA